MNQYFMVTNTKKKKRGNINFKKSIDNIAPGLN